MKKRIAFLLVVVLAMAMCLASCGQKKTKKEAPSKPTVGVSDIDSTPTVEDPAELPKEEPSEEPKENPEEEPGENPDGNPEDENPDMNPDTEPENADIVSGLTFEGIWEFVGVDYSAEDFSYYLSAEDLGGAQILTCFGYDTSLSFTYSWTVEDDEVYYYVQAIYDDTEFHASWVSDDGGEHDVTLYKEQHKNDSRLLVYDEYLTYGGEVSHWKRYFAPVLTYDNFTQDETLEIDDLTGLWEYHAVEVEGDYQLYTYTRQELYLHDGLCDLLMDGQTYYKDMVLRQDSPTTPIYCYSGNADEHYIYFMQIDANGRLNVSEEFDYGDGTTGSSWAVLDNITD